MTDVAETTDSEALSADEVAFFESRGEKGLPEPAKEPEKIEAKPEAKPDGKADAKPESDDPEAEETVDLPDNKGRFVRHGAFHAEREKRKALEKQIIERDQRLSQREQEFARVDERLKLLTEAVSAQEPSQPAPMPDPSKDIFGAFNWAVSRLKQIEGKQAETEKVSIEQRAEAELRNTYMASAQEFASRQTDFRDAYQFLMQGRDAELQAYGVSDPQERMRMIASEERGLVQRAMRDRVNPAERVYALAKARGYALKAPEPEPKPEPKVELKAADLDTIAKGIASSKSLSAAGGSPTDVLTAEALANMSDEEFGAYLAKLPKSQQRALMSGA